MQPWVLAVLVLATSCSKEPATTPQASGSAAPRTEPAQRPASVTDARVASIEAWLRTTDALNRDLASVGRDCKKLAAVLSSHAAAVKQANAKLDDATGAAEDADAAIRWIEATYGKRLDASTRRLNLLRTHCEADAAATAAYGELGLALPLLEGRPGTLEKELEQLERESPPP